jgi:hypothetical protein
MDRTPLQTESKVLSDRRLLWLGSALRLTMRFLPLSLEIPASSVQLSAQTRVCYDETNPFNGQAIIAESCFPFSSLHCLSPDRSKAGGCHGNLLPHLRLVELSHLAFSRFGSIAIASVALAGTLLKLR